MHKLVDGTYVVEFMSNLGAVGGGVVTAKSGSIVGGDSGFVYEGTFHADGDMLRGVVLVRRHSSQMVSIFGPADEFQLELRGAVNQEGGSFNGAVVGAPDLTMTVNLKRHQSRMG